MLGITVYWLSESNFIDESIMDPETQTSANEIIPWLIYVSSAAIFGVQIFGLFVPAFMNNID